MNTDNRIDELERRIAALEHRAELNVRPLLELDVISNRLNIHSCAVASELQRLSQSVTELRAWAERSARHEQ